MPIFTYQGYKNDGSAAKGTVEADGQRDAVIKIKAIGIFPKEITEAVETKPPNGDNWDRDSNSYWNQ